GGGRQARGVRQGRRLEVHPAADVPAGDDARPARPPRQRGDSRVPRALRPPMVLGAPLRHLALALALLLGASGCSVISVDLSPRIRPLDEETVDGTGSAKILLLDLSGLL